MTCRQPVFPEEPVFRPFPNMGCAKKVCQTLIARYLRDTRKFPERATSRRAARCRLSGDQEIPASLCPSIRCDRRPVALRGNCIRLLATILIVTAGCALIYPSGAALTQNSTPPAFISPNGTQYVLEVDLREVYDSGVGFSPTAQNRLLTHCSPWP